MISGVFLLNQKGDILIHRDFRGDAPRKVADFFRHQVIFSTEPNIPPIKIVGHTTFFHIKVNDIYIMASARNNVNATEVFEVLLRISGVFKSYFGALDEEAVKTNFVLIYELLDEIVDFGYPQNMDTDTLKMYITQQGMLSENPAEDQKKITIQATGATTWRKEGIKYRKNTVYLDVVESVSLLVSSRGTVLHSEASGKIIFRSQLSGMPECKFGLNDRLVLSKESVSSFQKNKQAKVVDIEDLKFHQCVRLGRFDADRTISFVPPDGVFELMRYRTSEHIIVPFKILPIVTMHGTTRMEIKVKVKSMFPPHYFGDSVVITIPVPKNTATATLVTSFGNAKYVGPENAIYWTIKQLVGDSEHSLSGEVELLHTVSDKRLEHAPISMTFKVPGLTASGLQVRFLRVYEKSSYETKKYVRYETNASTYQHRV